MKDKMIKILKEKKEIFIFAGVILVVFGAVLGISLLAKNNTVPVFSDDTTENNPTTSGTTSENNITDTPPVVLEKMILPIAGEYEIVRHYFDEDDPSTMAKAVIANGNSFSESNGISFAKADNSTFDCLAVFSGKVLEIKEDTSDGMVVTILHDNNVTSTYSSLSSIDVSVDDYVKAGSKIGVSGESMLDPEAKMHVHLELKKDDKYINPINAFDKELTEIAAINTK